MKPTQQIDTLEDLMDNLIAEGETVALQKLRQMIEVGEEFNLNGLYQSLARKENEDERTH